MDPRLLSVLLAVAPTTVAGQPPAPPAEHFAEGTEVTAVDVVAELPERGARRWLPGGGGSPPGELVAFAGGEALPVIAVEEASPRLDRLVLYFDLSLSDDYQVEWAADLLAGWAAGLVALGEVEIVVAEREALTVLPPTREVEAVEEALGRLGFFSRPQDALTELRVEGGDGGGRRGSGGAPAPGRGGRDGIVGLEAELIRRSLDELLLALVARSDGGGSPAGPRRAVLLVSGGFDLRPGAGSRPGAPSLEPVARETGRTLAAYGWRVIPLLAPEAGGPVGGLRLGKWRFAGGGAVYEEDREPELAEAHLERARALRDGGRLEQAAEAARTAVHHFAGDPRTGERQTEALLLLAELYEGLGDPQRARRELRRAARFAPERVADHPWAAALPQEPGRGLTALADAGGGTVGRGAPDLSEALHRLGRRAVVTVQMPGSPDGSLHRIEIRERGGRERPLAVAWGRFGTPPAVEEARRRR